MNKRHFLKYFTIFGTGTLLNKVEFETLADWLDKNKDKKLKLIRSTDGFKLDKVLSVQIYDYYAELKEVNDHRWVYFRILLSAKIAVTDSTLKIFTTLYNDEYWEFEVI